MMSDYDYIHDESICSLSPPLALCLSNQIDCTLGKVVCVCMCVLFANRLKMLTMQQHLFLVKLKGMCWAPEIKCESLNKKSVECGCCAFVCNRPIQAHLRWLYERWMKAELKMEKDRETLIQVKKNNGRTITIGCGLHSRCNTRM